MNSPLRKQPMYRSFGLLAFGVLLATDAFAQVKLPTLDEAMEHSSKTGQPIFVMAGQET